MKEDRQEHNPQDAPVAAPKPRRRRWLRIAIKVVVCIFAVILLLPAVVYIPPVQTLLKNVACNVIKKSTGMDVSIDRFRLKFPLDVSLQGVAVVEAGGDTMVKAKELLADVRLLPLLDLDIKLNKLRLSEGYYRMVSPDSSMIMKINAGMLEADSKSSFSLSQMRLVLNKATLKDADVSLYMNVWKQQPDTTSEKTPFDISINDFRGENIRFAMSMLPTIDTLTFNTSKIHLAQTRIDLGNSRLTAGLLEADNGDLLYLSPTQEYIASHPLPADTVNAEPSAPFVIEGKKIALRNFSALYATQGATPQPGFDPAYIRATGINIALDDFYNSGADIRLPITTMSALERSGLCITSASGLVSLQNEVLGISDFNVTTTASRLNVDMTMPLAFMDPGSDALIVVNADGSIGMPDVNAFMPALKTYTSAIPRGSSLNLNVDASGNMASVDLRRLDVEMPKVLKLYASGWVKDPMDMKRLQGQLKFDGKLTNPHVADRLAGIKGLNLPALTIRGWAKAAKQTYEAEFDLLTSAGDLAAGGKVSLTAESYSIDADINNFDVSRFVPDIGLGKVTASVYADGAGFNPTKPKASTDARIVVTSAVYRGHDFRNIELAASLEKGDFLVNLTSPDPLLDVMLTAQGHIAPDDYTFDVDADIRNADLRALGLMDSVCNGNARIVASGTASPDRWLYDVNLDIPHIDWHLTGMDINVPEGLKGYLRANTDDVALNLEGKGTYIAFNSPTNLKNVVDRFMAVGDNISTQIAARNLNVDSLQRDLPPFMLRLNASGRGLLGDVMAPMGYSVDSVYGTLGNSDIIQGFFGVNGIGNGSLEADTITLSLKQRGSLLDYVARMGNRPGTLDEFHKVEARGYAGTNRVSLLLNQQNLQGETGYKLGLTGAFMDSVITMHFTPLKSTIAYMPWTFNADNHIDIGPGKRIDANLLANSKESNILLETIDNADGNLALHAMLDNIKIADFLKISMFAPPITGTLNSNVNLVYKGNNITGSGSLGMTDFYYERTRVGNFDMNFDAALDLGGDTRARGALLINGKEALQAFGIIRQNQDTVSPMDMGVKLEKFPLSLANAFLDKKMLQLNGALDGAMRMKGSMAKPMLNGSLTFDSVSVYIPMMGSALRFDNNPVTVNDNVVSFDKFNIWGQNSNPLTINGTVDARSLRSVMLDMSLAADNFQLVNNRKKSGSDLYGKAFLSLNAFARGPLSHFDVGGNVNILNTTDISYMIPTAASNISQISSGEGVVKFVQFADTVKAQKDSLSSSLAMRINAALTINQGAKINVLLSGNGTDKVSLNPWGTLNYYQNYMGDMTLNGQLNLGTGFAQYTIPVLGRNVKFVFDEGSYVGFNGDIMNPSFNIKANNEMKVNVSQTGGNSSLVNFDVGLSVTNNLAHPDILFDLSTKDDITIENQLQSMTPDQRSNQAINLLLYGQYLGQGYSATGFNSESMLYGFLTSQLNSWAANHIKAVDLSFGVNQYESGTNGNTQSATSYSYQVSKSLFNNKFKIVVGGNYSTDASADENFSQNLINDISFEYMLRQTNTMSLFLKLFRHTDFESILEGEITETGVGFVMRRRINNLRQLFNFGRGHRNIPATDPTGNEK